MKNTYCAWWIESTVQSATPLLAIGFRGMSRGCGFAVRLFGASLIVAACSLTIVATEGQAAAAPHRSPVKLDLAAPDAIAVDSSGRTLVAGIATVCPPTCDDGSLYIGRVLHSGRPDRHFGGGDGFVTAPLAGDSFSAVLGLGVTASGDIVSAARTIPASSAGERGLVLVRLTRRGQPETSVSQAGVQSLIADGFFVGGGGFYGALPSHALSVDGESVLIAGALASDPGDPYSHGTKFAVAKIGADGGLDQTFGNGGLASVEVQPGGAFEDADAIAVGPDGRIVLAGASGAYDPSTSVDTQSFAAAELSPDGSPDPSFSEDGAVVVATATGVHGDLYENLTSRALEVGLQSGGKVLLIGPRTGGKGACSNITMFRLLADGSPDSQFGDDGLVRPQAPVCQTAAQVLSLDADNILAAGSSAGTSAYSVEPSHALLASYAPDGALKNDRAPVDAYSSAFTAIATQADGDRVAGLGLADKACGEATDGPVARCATAAVARLRPGGKLDKDFGHRGVSRLPAIRP